MSNYNLKLKIQFFILCFLFIVCYLTKIRAAEKEEVINDKIYIFGKVIQITDYPKNIFGIETTNNIMLELKGEKSAGLEDYKDSFVKMEGYLGNISVYTRYSFNPVSWEKISPQELESFENKIKSQFSNIRWESTKSQKWARISKNLNITLNNSQEGNIKIIFVEMDIYGLPSQVKKRWYFGKLPKIVPSYEIEGKKDFSVEWNCEKLEFTDNEEMRYEVKIGYTDSSNILAICKFISQNKWCSTWKSEREVK
ncbi:MAG: hypothetical protein HY934_00810 [Candidatus Firestonebacteria bacterium]|nr:hypothetical protein [Candidatus Firestonebacteria bacterium]